MNNDTQPPMHDDSTHYDDDGTGCRSRSSCIFSAAHGRLSEAHRQIHHAEQNYSDPAAFTGYLNGCIQSLRNVTFVLQSQKRLILDFDTWYQPWQGRLAEDRILRWIISARNQIVKQGDLATYSVANYAIMDDYSNPPSVEIPFPPLESIESLAETISNNTPMSTDVRANGLIRIDRRWIVKELPDVELLEAVSHAYTTLSYLISDAHLPPRNRIERTELPEQLPGQRLVCMSHLARSRTHYYRIRDLAQLRTRIVRTSLPRLDIEEVLNHYGHANLPKQGDLKNHRELRMKCEQLFALGRVVIERDGNHKPIVFILNSERMQMSQVAFDDKTDKLMVFREYANEVERLRAHAIIMIGEVWVTTRQRTTVVVANGNRIERDEALVLSAISSSGERIAMKAPIYRTAEGIFLGETEEKPELVPSFFEPVIERWKAMFDRAKIAPERPAVSQDISNNDTTTGP